MKSQVLHTVCWNISGEAAGEIRNWSLLGGKGFKRETQFYEAIGCPRKEDANCRIGAGNDKRHRSRSGGREKKNEKRKKEKKEPAFQCALCNVKAGLHVRRKHRHKHEHKHKPRVNRDDASTSARKRNAPVSVPCAM